MICGHIISCGFGHRSIGACEPFKVIFQLIDIELSSAHEQTNNIGEQDFFLEQLPLQTLKANIDYGFTEAFTNYGQIGIKVWIYTGDVEKEKMTSQTGEVEEI